MQKNKLLLATLMLVAVLSVQAQFTLRLSGGYAGPGFQNSGTALGPDIDPATPQIDQLSIMANINDSAKTYKQVHGSYGTGANVSLGMGYMFNRFIGIDLGIAYGHSANISSYDVRQMYPTNAYLYATTTSFAYAVALTPSVVISGAKSKWKVYPYGRFGIVLPVVGRLTDDVHINTPYAGTYGQPNGSPINFKAAPFFLGVNTDVQLVTQGDVSVGFGGAVGVAYRPIPLINVFIEANGQYLNVRAKSATVTEWNIDGVSALPTAANPGGTGTTRSVYRTQINFVDQLNAQSNNGDPQYGHPVNSATGLNYDPTKPKQDIRPVNPGSNLGFNVGITFFLSKKTLTKEKPQPKASLAF